MSLLFLFLAALAAGASVDGTPPAPVAPAQVEDGLTDGWVSMRPDRWLSIIYDREPGTVLTSFPGHAGYDSYLELAGGLEPGQRKRIARPGPNYTIDDRGTYVVRELATVGPWHLEPLSQTIGTSHPKYRCYHDVLRGREIGEHIMTLADWRMIETCLGED